MHCKNCGAQYRARDLACPYCGTENLVGRIWMSQVTEAEVEYEMAREEAGKGLPVYVMNRVLNRVLLLSMLLIILLVSGITAVSALDLGTLQFKKHLKADEIEQQSKLLYEEGRLDELYQLLSEYDLFDPDTNYVYSQAALMGYDYRSFKRHRMAFAQMSDQEREEDDYHLEYMLRDGFDVLGQERGVYEELAPENAKLFADMSTDIRACMIGMLGMTEEEVRTFEEMDYIYSSDLEAMVETLRKREVWK